MANLDFIDKALASIDHCPWATFAGATHDSDQSRTARRHAIYTPDERRRRDASKWTLVQGVLAPLQFLVFAVSLWLILRYLSTGEGLALATASVVAKTLVLYTIMVTGSIWEREVFGRYLFAPSFFWEDVVSMLVIALHTAYLYAVVTGALDAREQIMLALMAYASYVINAAQFLIKLRAARREADQIARRYPLGGAT